MKHRCSLAVALGLALLAGVGAAQPRTRYDGDHAGPASLDSPAWRELMAEPLHRAQTMSYHAAALAAGWGRQAEATALRNHLLVLHGQALLSGLPEGRLADLMGRPPAEPAALQAAWHAGLNHAWADVGWESAPPLGGLPQGATPWPSHAGFWRLRNGGLAAHAVVRNRAPIVIALPGALHLDLRSGDKTLSLVCTSVGISGRWLPDESARFWCASAGAVADAAWSGTAVPRWRSNLPPDESALGEWVERLAGSQPPSVAALAVRHAHCRDQMNCVQGKVPTTAELARRQAEADAREPAVRAQREREQTRDEAVRGLYLWGLLVAGFALYALVARVAGTALANGTVIGLSLMAAVWLFGEFRSGRTLGLLILTFGALPCGVGLAWIYRWLYRRFLATG